MYHYKRLFLKPEGIKLASATVLKRLKCALVPILCVTIDVVSQVFAAVVSEEKNYIGYLNEPK